MAKGFKGVSRFLSFRKNADLGRSESMKGRGDQVRASSESMKGHGDQKRVYS